MIRKTAIALVLLAAVIFSGCGAKNPDGEKSGAPATSQEVWEQTPAASEKSEEQNIIDSFIRVEAPDFTLEKADGTKVTLSELKGKPVVLNFWAKWCPYCIKEFPYFTQAMADFPDIAFYSIDTMEKTDIADKEDREEMEKFAVENGFSLPVLFDADNKVSGLYGLQGLPATFFIDSKGDVRAGFPGALPDYDTLKKFLNAFIKADKQ